MFSAISRILSSGFVRNVRTLASGNAFAQAITLLLTPVVARLFTPADFGVAALFLSISMVIGIVASLRYDQAIVLPVDDHDGYGLLALSMLAALFVAILLLFLVVVISVSMPDFEWVRTLGAWIYAIPLAVVLVSTSYAINSWWIRKKNYRRMVFGSIAQNTVNSGSRIGSGLVFGSSVGGLIISIFLGFVCRLAALSRGLLVSRKGIGAGFKADQLRTLALEYRQFPLYGAPAALLKQLAENLPVLMLSLMFGPAVVGLYAIANRLVRMPVDVVAGSVRTVFLQRMAEKSNAGEELRKDLIKSVSWMAVIGLIPALLLMFVGEMIFGWLLGDRWAEAGRYAAILAPWVLVVFALTPAGTIFVVLRKQALLLRMHGLRTLLAGVALYVPYAMGRGAEDTLIAFVGMGIISNLGILITAFKLTSDRYEPSS